MHIRKCEFGASEIMYLGYMLTQEGIKPNTDKNEAIINLTMHEIRKDIRRLLCMLQYYRDLWKHRSHIIAPLTDSDGGSDNKKRKRVWT